MHTTANLVISICSCNGITNNVHIFKKLRTHPAAQMHTKNH